MNGTMTETDLQNQIRLELSKYGIVLRLNVGTFHTMDGRTVTSGLPPGTSDLVFIGANKVAFIEVKTPTGRPSKDQVNFINKMRELGHTAGIARSVDDAIQLINQQPISNGIKKG